MQVKIVKTKSMMCSREELRLNDYVAQKKVPKADYPDLIEEAGFLFNVDITNKMIKAKLGGSWLQLQKNEEECEDEYEVLRDCRRGCGLYK